VPGRERRYEDLASKALGIELAADADARVGRIVWLLVAVAAAVFIVVRVRSARSA
jgi:hypothetical protein